MALFHEWPYTDYHNLNADFLMKIAKESLGLHLEINGNALDLKNANGDTISHVTISYAEKALKDADGNEVTTYLIDAARDGRAIVFDRGNGNTVTIQLPTDAITDKNGKDITEYIANVSVNGNTLKIADGAGNFYLITVPFATTADKDSNNKVISTYVADVNVNGNNIIVKDGAGNTIRTFTVAFATEAGTAEEARKDVDGDAIKSTYATELIIDGNKIGLESKDGTTLNKITVPFATVSTDATNAIESVTISGNTLVFRTYGGTVTNITVPYAIKATNDGSGNEIVSNYVADVVNDSQTGEITFLAKDGSTIATLIPTVDSAVHDSYGNTIADFVKTIAVSANSDYVTVTHGTGTTDTLQINYANKAWKDTNGNIIKNVYLKSLECVEDSDTGHYVLVGYNGENSEILRIELTCYMAQRAIGDVDGDHIDDTYVASGALNSDNELELKSKHGTVLSTVAIPKGFEVDKVYHYRNAFRMHQDTLNSNVYPNVAYPTFLQEYAMKSGGYTQNKRPFTFGYYDMDVTTFKDTDVIMIEVGNVGYHYDVGGDTCMTYPDNGYVRYVISLPSSVTIAAGAAQKVVVDAPYLYQYQSVLGFGVPKFPPCVEAIPDAGANTTVSISHRTGNLDNGYYVLDITNDSASSITVSSVICFIDMKPYANALAVKPLSPSNPDIYAVPGTYLFSGYTLKELIPMCLSIGTLDSDDEYTECPIPYFWNGSYVHGKIKIVCPIAEDVVGAYNDIWGVQYLDASGSHAPNDTPGTIPSQYVEKVSDGFIIDLDTWMNDTGESAYAFRVWIYDDSLFGEYYTVWY